MAKKPRPTPVAADFLTPLYDAHTHLASCGATDQEAITALLDRAAAAGVVGVCTVGDGLAETELAVAAAHLDERVVAAVAVHPTKAHLLDEPTRARLGELAADPRCVAIGETGLDHYWTVHRPEDTATQEQQEEALRWHIDLARRVDKPLMIHNRDADEALLAVLADAPPTKAVILHCFSSPLSVGKEAIARGYVLSFAGNVTFKRNEELREIAALCPPEQYLIETDAPYMTPEPFRGARNESQFIGHTARCLAAARGVDPQQVADEVTATARRLYDLEG